MLGRTRHLILGPMLAIGTTGTVLAGLVGTAHAAITPATIQVSGLLNVRTGPSSAGGIVATLRNGDPVTIACHVTGQYVQGTVRGTAQWDRLTSGSYISHAYVVTAEAIAPCAGSGPELRPVTPVASGPVNTASRARFIAASVAPAQRSQRDWRVPASVTIAQAILESGWGRSGLSSNDNNFFGMKCFGKGPIAVGCRVYRTYECANGVCAPTHASFRSYASVTDSFRDHGRLLGTAPRYRPAFAHTRNPNQFLAEVHKAGYATSPTYTTNVQRLMQSYNLYQYDLR